MFCGNCGKKLSDTASFCPECGTPVESEQNKTQSVVEAPIVESVPESTPESESMVEPKPEPTVTEAPTPEPSLAPNSASGASTSNQMNIPIRNYDPRWDYTPLGAWTYFLYSLLFSLPLAGWIIALVFAVGGTNRINLRNYARSYFCMLLISVIVVVIVLAIVLGVAGTEIFRHASHNYYM